jgi:hypothetical protein
MKTQCESTPLNSGTPGKWRRAAERLQLRYRSLVTGMLMAVANEEARIARSELRGQLESIPAEDDSKNLK